jgi:regulation of enolase protein 1 (concanavalin A-like superfamily)
MKSTFARWSAALALSGITMAAQAGVFTDSFSTSRDYLTQGVVGTGYQGLTAGVIAPGTIASWDANITAANTLTLTNTGGGWRADGDGPFLWKLVTGDFTNIVHVSDMSQANYHFAGLMARVPGSYNSQSYVSLGMFAEFSIGLVYRDTVANSDSDNGWTPAYHVETNKTTWASWMKITRVGNLISLEASTNGTLWESVYQTTRDDFPATVQVGMYDSTFSENQCWAQFQNFSIEGPNVGIEAPPGQATGLALTAGVNSLNVSWSPGTGSSGTLIVVRHDSAVTYQPVDGTNYPANAVFGSGGDIGESNFVVYASSGSSVTVTNLIPSVPYMVAAYAYSGSDSSTVYAISNALSAYGIANGTPLSISLSFGATNAVAVDDWIKPVVTLHFDGGGTLTVTSNSVLSSASPTVASVTNKAVYGLSAGAAAITATYQSFSTTSNLLVVKLPVSDDFNDGRNFLTQGVTGTGWSGVLLDTNDLPVGGNGTAVTLLADSGISSPRRLTVQSYNANFSVGQDSGFFLYKIVTGDFSLSVQIVNFNATPYHMPGIMVRAPFELNYTEGFLQWLGFNEYGIGNLARQSKAGSYSEPFSTSEPAYPFIMVERATNTFNFYGKAHALDAWTLVASEEHGEYSGVPLQVGLVEQTFTGNTGVVAFANMVLALPNSNSVAPAAPSGLTLATNAYGEVVASWTAGASSSGSVVIARAGGAITRQPVDGDDFASTANQDYTLGGNLGASNVVVYAGSGTLVTVTNLPALSTSFAVYSYKTDSNTNYYNLTPATGTIDLSGAVPAVTVGMQKVSDGLQLTWTQGALLEATNVLGPWTTNTTATSPYLITSPVGTKFFKVQVR